MKKILLLVLLLCPFIVNAACDKDKFTSNIKEASHITYDNKFNEATKKYDITLYAVSDNFSVYIGKTKYNVVKNTVSITGITQGSEVDITIYGDDGCGEQIKNIYLSELYYNSFYKSDLCREYEGKISGCSYEFTKNQITREYLDKVIDNYNNSLDPAEEEKEPETLEVSFKEAIKKVFLNWGVKALLAVVTTLVSITIYKHRYNKIKHGI